VESFGGVRGANVVKVINGEEREVQEVLGDGELEIMFSENKFFINAAAAAAAAAKI